MCYTATNTVLGTEGRPGGDATCKARMPYGNGKSLCSLGHHARFSNTALSDRGIHDTGSKGAARGGGGAYRPVVHEVDLRGKKNGPSGSYVDGPTLQ